MAGRGRCWGRVELRLSSSQRFANSIAAKLVAGLRIVSLHDARHATLIDA